jgi:hypothetical protein
MAELSLELLPPTIKHHSNKGHQRETIASTVALSIRATR